MRFSGILILFIALLSGCEIASQKSRPVQFAPPIIVTGYMPLDCGASDLVFHDVDGNIFHLYNKPFKSDLVLSWKFCTETPDPSCSVLITKGHPLQNQLITALQAFAESQRDTQALQEMRKQSDFTKLSKEEQLLAGTLTFLDGLKNITELPYEDVEGAGKGQELEK